MVWNETQLNNKCYCSVTKATSLSVIGSYSLTLITDLISPGCFSDTVIGLMVPLHCGQKCQLSAAVPFEQNLLIQFIQ